MSSPYLFKITNVKKELKAISSDGFNNTKILAEDKEFKLFFSAYGDEYLEFKLAHLIEEKDYYTFDFFPKETPYIHLNQFSHSIKKQNHKSYIVVISSQIEFKYEVEFKDIDKITPNCRIDIEELKQISFSIEDEELLKGKI